MGNLPKRKCAWCSEWFQPHRRLGKRQKSCGRTACKRQQKRASQCRWQRRERGDYQQAQRDWRKAHPDYWRTYRKEHPSYTERNRIQSRIRWAQSKETLQKRIDILQVHENSMEYWNLMLFAKQPRSLGPLIWAYSGAHEFTCGSQPQAP